MNLFKPARSKNWYCWYHHPISRKQLSFSCKTSKKQEALAFALSKLQQLATEQKETSQARSMTVSLFAEEYLKRCEGLGFTRKTRQAIDSSFRLFCQRIGDKEIGKVTLADCESFILENQPSVLTARKHYGHLRAALDQAVLREYCVDNPFKRFAKPRATPYEADSLTPTELATILNIAPSGTFSQRRLVRMVKIAFATGLRLAELRHLEASAIDIERKLLYVFNSRSFRTKSGKSRAVPIDQDTLELLLNQLEDNTHIAANSAVGRSLLFPSQKGHVLSESAASNQFRNLCRTTFPSRQKLCFHCLRHSFATNHAISGIPLQEIQRAMGHSSVAVTERYAHLQRAEYPAFRAFQNV